MDFFCNGKRDLEPRLFTAACLADTLGVSLDYLAGFGKEADHG